MYYVYVIDGPLIDGEITIKRFGLLAGPYETHEEALDKVDAVRKIAGRINAWACFYAFGTVKLKTPIGGGYPPGRLNHLLATDAEATLRPLRHRTIAHAAFNRARNAPDGIPPCPRRRWCCFARALAGSLHLSLLLYGIR